MSKARQLADLLDSNGDVVVGALDNAPDPDLTPYALQTTVDAITTDVVADTTPQLGGNLDLNGNDITGLGKITTDIGSVGGTDQVLAEFKAEDTRKVGVFWDDSESTLGIGTITNHPLVFHTNGNSNKKMVLDQNGRVRFAGTGSYNSILYGTGGGGFNEIFVSGYSAPNVAFEYDFNKQSYANIFEVTCGISHWSDGYYSYKKCIVHTLNTNVYIRNNEESNGGNGSWSISAPASGTLRVRMNGDAGYSYASGWFIKISGILRNSDP